MRAMKKFVAFSAFFVAVVLLPSLGCSDPATSELASSGHASSHPASPGPAALATNCVAATLQVCNYGHWIVYNHVRGPTPGKYVIHAHSASYWSITADQNGGGRCGGCAVEAFDSAQWDYNSVPYSSIKYLTSSFSETMPTGSLQTNGVDAEAAYDMFINGRDTDEVMVWVDNQGQTPAGRFDRMVMINGQKFALYLAGGTKSFLLTQNETSGTIDYYAILRWLHMHGMLKSSDSLYQFNFGWEICNTNGVPRTFTVRSLTLHQKL
jgi:hypothetical protein